MEHKNVGDSNCIWCARYNHQMIGIGTGGIRNKSTSGDHPALLRSSRILRRVLVTWEDLRPLKLHWNTISYRWCEELSSNEMINISSKKGKVT